MSTAIIQLSENGGLKRIQDLWLTSGNCAANSNNMETAQLNLSSFWGLFLVTGTASALSLVIYLSRLLWKFHREQSDATDPRNPTSRSKRFIKSFASYVNQSAIAKDRKRASGSSGKQKKNVESEPDQSSSTDQMSQIYQSSPFSQSSLFSQSSPSYQNSPSYHQNSLADQSPHHVDNTELKQSSP